MKTEISEHHGKNQRGLMGFTQAFLHMEAAGGILLVIFATLALIVANSPFYTFYDYVLHDVKIGFAFQKSFLHWINDGLMAIFFFLVGLEIKREFISGELSSRARALLPFIAAIGGMAVPAAIYWFFNRDIPANLGGWAIPSATDIAFSLGVLALLGSRVPLSLKILLTAIAVIDDLGAVIIIALFYTDQLLIEPLIFAAFCLAALAVLNRVGVSKITPYILIGLVLWVAVLKSGVHATLAGVALAMFIPVRTKRNPAVSPLEHLMHALHPWVAFGILPIFAFANAGVPFAGMGLHSLSEPVALGIIAGLFIGKQLGIFGALFLCIRAGLTPMPAGAGWLHLYGISILCGIGFTMSLFIGGLAFEDLAYQASIRLGVLVGSLLSAVAGYAVLRKAVAAGP